MIRGISLVCGCKVELTIIPPGGCALLEDSPIQGVLTSPCVYHRTAPCVDWMMERSRITGLN